MCGILGIIRKNGLRDGDRAAAKDMAAALERRGPDGEDFHDAGNALLGCRRLAIVDVENGIQPMTIDSLSIVLNGEIYNHAELRQELEKKGVIFQTRSDTEVLLRLYQEHGEGCLDLIDGQFAFAIWDEKKKEAFLARDRFGEKPLHFAKIDDGLIFASMPGAILKHPEIKREPDQYTLGFFLLQAFTFAAGDAPLDRSFFKGIRELPPGHSMTYSNGNENIRRWYSHTTDERSLGLDEAITKVRETLSQSIKKRLSNEVKNGVALSGGLDSSIVAAVACGKDNKLIASSISFEGDSNEDLEYAKKLAHISSLPLMNTGTKPEEIREIIDRIVDAMESPHCMLRQIGMIENYRMLREAGVKVILIGEGADELFFGYWHKFPGFKSDDEIIGEGGKFREMCRRRIDIVKSIFTDEFNQMMDYDRAVDEMCSSFEHFDSQDTKRKAQNFYLDNFLSSFLLRANDRLSMHNSIEARLPFLAKDVVETAGCIPPKLNISEESEKEVLRKAFKDMLPKEIANRRKAPLPAAVHKEYHQEILSFLMDSIEDADPQVWRILRKERMKEICQEFKNRLDEQGDGTELVRFRPLDQEFAASTIHIFSILTILRWHKNQISLKDGEFQKHHIQKKGKRRSCQFTK
jgi:asparagine synthase (glutamine-hydrolysing)